jgi:hypothetical protein
VEGEAGAAVDELGPGVGQKVSSWLELKPQTYGIGQTGLSKSTGTCSVTVPNSAG